MPGGYAEMKEAFRERQINDGLPVSLLNGHISSIQFKKFTSRAFCGSPYPKQISQPGAPQLFWCGEKLNGPAEFCDWDGSEMGEVFLL
jgi:hypothetical protein